MIGSPFTSPVENDRRATDGASRGLIASVGAVYSGAWPLALPADRDSVLYSRSRRGGCMIDEIELRREELRKICNRFRLRRVDFFGSAARGHLKAERILNMTPPRSAMLFGALPKGSSA